MGSNLPSPYSSSVPKELLFKNSSVSVSKEGIPSNHKGVQSPKQFVHHTHSTTNSKDKDYCTLSRGSISSIELETDFNHDSKIINDSVRLQKLDTNHSNQTQLNINSQLQELDTNHSNQAQSLFKTENINPQLQELDTN